MSVQEKAESKVIVLDVPITVYGNELTEVTMRLPKVLDQRMAEDLSNGSDTSADIQLYMRLCDIPEEAVHQLVESDYLRLNEAYRDFIQAKIIPEELEEALEVYAHTYEIPLEFPIKVKDAQYSALTMRRPTVKDMDKIESQSRKNMPEFKKAIFRYARLCGVSVTVIESLAMKDLVKLYRTYTNFLYPKSTFETSEG